MKICKWASNYYQYPLGQVYFSCIPTKLRKNIIVNVTDSRSFYEITEKRVNDYFKNKSAQKRIYEAIKSKIKVKSKEIKLSNPLKLLLQNGFIKKASLIFQKKLLMKLI